jgi:protein-S-isoprenylcysteine O-methyltransferase Ste14
MPGLALALLAVYGLLAFVGRILVQLRMTGSTGVVGLSGRLGSVEWLGGVLFLLAIVFVPLGPALQLADVVSPIDLLDSELGYLVGMTLFAFGCAATVYSQLVMGASWRIGVGEGEETELVTAGPFGWVRNPIYSAMIPAMVGIVLLAPTWISLGALALLVLALEIQVRAVEEPWLLRSQPAYPDYAARVGRFVPGVGRLRR